MSAPRRFVPLFRAPCALLAVAALLSPGLLGQVQIWDASAEYSATQNSSGAWTYGWSANRGAPLNLFPQSGVRYCGSLSGWSNQFPQFPAITKNESAATFCCTTARIAPGQVVLHPGQVGENAVLRWTAPDAGSYYVEVEFAGADFGFPTNSDVAVLHNLSTLFSAEMSSYDGPPDCASTASGVAHRFEMVVQANQGDSIDCNVGFGANQRFNGDSTAVSARITRVSESFSVGSPCGGTAVLGTNAPILGQGLTTTVSVAAGNALGLLDFASGSPQPSALLGCTLYPSITSQMGTVTFTTDPSGFWQSSLALPSSPTWHGFQFTIQALILNGNAPENVEFSNGWVLTL